jgi:sporulation protein YlmC with PRC-barrel domain
MAQSTYAGSGFGTGAPAQSTSAKSLIESDRVEGTSVYGSDNTHIGTIKRLMIDKQSGQVAYAVMSFGGFLGMGEDTYTIPWAKLDYETDLGGYKTDISPDSIKGAPDFYRDRDYGWNDRDQERKLHDYYGVSPYWGL